MTVVADRPANPEEMNLVGMTSVVRTAPLSDPAQGFTKIGRLARTPCKTRLPHPAAHPGRSVGEMLRANLVGSPVVQAGAIAKVGSSTLKVRG